MRLLVAYCAVMRLGNCLIAAFGVIVGYYLLPGDQLAPLNYIYPAAAFFICGFGNILNDIVDYSSDKTNHPHRPLPMGTLSSGQAYVFAALFFLVALGLMIPMSWPGRLLAAGAIIGLIWYDLSLKHIMVAGNVVVALLGGLPFVFAASAYGLAAVVAVPGPILAGIFAFCMHFSREIVKDMADAEGDARTGSKTLPIKYGQSSAALVAMVSAIILSVVCIASWLRGWFSDLFMIIVGIMVLAPLFVEILLLFFPAGQSNVGKIALLIKLQMLPALAALLVGKAY